MQCTKSNPVSSPSVNLHLTAPPCPLSGSPLLSSHTPLTPSGPSWGLVIKFGAPAEVPVSTWPLRCSLVYKCVGSFQGSCAVGSWSTDSLLCALTATFIVSQLFPEAPAAKSKLKFTCSVEWMKKKNALNVRFCESLLLLLCHYCNLMVSVRAVILNWEGSFFVTN